MSTIHKFLTALRRYGSFKFTLALSLTLISLLGGYWRGWPALAKASHSKAAATGHSKNTSPLITPLVQPVNAGDGYLSDGVTTAGGGVCGAPNLGLWNTAATEQKGVFTNTFSSHLPVGVSSNEGTFLKDVNGDGKLDIVFILDTSAGANAGTYVWLGNGDGTFQTAAIEKKTYTSTLVGGAIETGASTSEATFLGDVNNDGRNDIVYVVDASNPMQGGKAGTYVWLANNDGTFATAAIEKTNYTNTAGPPLTASILAGIGTNEGTFLVDVNNDTNLDILYVLDSVAPAAAGTYVWLGNGDGTFATTAIEKKTYTSTLASGDIEAGTTTNEGISVGDVNGDSLPDIVYVLDNGANAGTYVWLGLGDGTFATAAIEKKTYTSTLPSGDIETGATNSEGSFLVDADNDGKLDILYLLDGSGLTNSGTYLWLGQGDGTFATAAVEQKGVYSNTATSDIETGVTANEVSRVVDLNQDGRLDIVWLADSVIGTDSGVYIWFGRCLAPALTKAFSPTMVNVGQNSTLTFTITNTNGNPAQSGMAFTDTLPSGLTLAAAPTASQCGGTVTGTMGGNTIGFSSGTLVSGTPNCLIVATVVSSTTGAKNNTSANISGVVNLDASGVNATLTVNSACVATLSKPDESFPNNGGTGSFNVQIDAGCMWTATTNSPFITITAPVGTTTGPGTVSYTVAGHSNLSRRSDTISAAGKTYTVLQGQLFLDVPTSHPFYTVIGKLSARGITNGCSASHFCPDDPLPRQQMAAFLSRSLGVFNPPMPGAQRFLDVPSSNPFYAFIEEIAVRQITLGCGGGNFCPLSNVTREQAAAFIIRALGVPNPPMPAMQRFTDVPPSNQFYAFIDEMAARGITLGCGANIYCPTANVTRGQMAAFLVRAFNL